MPQSRIWTAVLTLVTAHFCGCSSDESTSEPSPSVASCQDASPQSCTCADGGTGLQSCEDGGLGPCVRSGDDGGVDGSDASKPETGTGGSGGADGGGPTDGGTKDGGKKDGGDKDGGDKDGGSSVACTADADCQVAGACPPDATMGCGCKFNPQNQGKCAPRCNTDSDCVQEPNKPMVCKQDKFCGPSNGDGGIQPPSDGGDAATD